jgi:hypothetical protein
VSDTTDVNPGIADDAVADLLGVDGAVMDDAVARTAELDGVPVAEHVARFDAVHRALTNALSAIDGA